MPAGNDGASRLIHSEEGTHMVLTVLEAHVAPEKAARLEEAYQQAIKQLDAGITQTLLLRGSTDSNTWRIVTMWQSREALDEMRRSGTPPRGVLMFRAADAEPVLSVFDVVAHAMESAQG
jgi:heme-degrading monooxygenase HmoA